MYFFVTSRYGFDVFVRCGVDTGVVYKPLKMLFTPESAKLIIKVLSLTSVYLTCTFDVIADVLGAVLTVSHRSLLSE